jgi:predicted aldo/keto reductase-like oxidoreductase
MDDAETTVFPEAAKHNTGVVIMNASARGGASTFVKDLSTAKGAPPEEDFYRYVLSRPEVHVSVKGLRDISRLK